jgi:hypothetical protein
MSFERYRLGLYVRKMEKGISLASKGYLERYPFQNLLIYLFTLQGTLNDGK